MQLRIRSYRPDDKKPLVEMTKGNWGGHDHLPYHIDEWVNDEDHFVFVGEIQGEIVGLSILRLMDDGMTGWMEGLRVHPDFRGMGIASKMSERLIEAGNKLGVKRYRLTLAEQNKASSTIASKLGLKPIVKKTSIWLDPESVEVNNLENIDSFERIQPTSLLEYSSILDLISRDVLIRHWFAYDVNQMNLSKLEEDNFLIAKRKDKAVALLHLFPIDDSEGPALCAGFYCQDELAFKSCLEYTLDIARSEKNKVILLIHDKKFRPLYDEYPWFTDNHNEIELALYERKNP